jgi:hypothetical protein
MAQSSPVSSQPSSRQSAPNYPTHDPTPLPLAAQRQVQAPSLYSTTTLQLSHVVNMLNAPTPEYLIWLHIICLWPFVETANMEIPQYMAPLLTREHCPRTLYDSEFLSPVWCSCTSAAYAPYKPSSLEQQTRSVDATRSRMWRH